MAAGPSVTPFDEPPLLVDLAPTILAALDAPASIEHTGKVLRNVVGAEATVPAGSTAGTVDVDDRARSVSDTEADEMEEHLRGLGYLE